MSSITREAVLAMDLKSIFAAVKDPKTSADMQKLMGDRGSGVAKHISTLMLENQNREAEVDAQLARTVPPSTEDLAAEAQAMVEPVVPTPPIVEVVVPAVAAKPYEAEDAELKKIGVTVVRDASGVPTRYIEEYHVRTEDGTPIGRATHLEAKTLPELMAKKQEVHTQATRAFHRLKQQKLTFKQEKTILTPEAISEAARIALESKDPAKVTDVIHQVIETEYQKREQELTEKQWREEGRRIANEFMRRHLHDYVPCEANNKALGEYLEKHNLDYTLDNLEVAFEDLLEQGDKLAKVETVATRQASVVANPTPAATAATPVTPAIPVAEPTIAVPASVVPAQPVAVVAPVVEATATTPVTAPNVQPVTRRPGVGGSIVPGSLSAQRPGTPEPALARKEFLKDYQNQNPEEMRKRLKDPQYVKKLEAYGIKVR